MSRSSGVRPEKDINKSVSCYRHDTQSVHRSDPVHGNGHPYRSYHAQVAMQSLRGVQECAVDAQAIHGRFELLGNLATLAHTTADQFPPMLDTAYDLTHGTREVVLRQGIGLVDML